MAEGKKKHVNPHFPLLKRKGRYVGGVILIPTRNAHRPKKKKFRQTASSKYFVVLANGTVLRSSYQSFINQNNICQCPLKPCEIPDVKVHVQSFTYYLKCGPLASSTGITKECTKMQILGFHPDLLNQSAC